MSQDASCVPRCNMCPKMPQLAPYTSQLHISMTHAIRQYTEDMLVSLQQACVKGFHLQALHQQLSWPKQQQQQPQLNYTSRLHRSLIHAIGRGHDCEPAASSPGGLASAGFAPTAVLALAAAATATPQLHNSITQVNDTRDRQRP